MGWGERFRGYVERLGGVPGHADRRRPLRAYGTGLLLPGARKGVEPMAARRPGSNRSGSGRRTGPRTTSWPKRLGTMRPCRRP